MKKNFFVSFIALIFIVACNQESTSESIPVSTNEQDNTNLENDKTNGSEPDYSNMFIYDINELSIVIAPFADDPEASYPVYEIFIDKETVVGGEIESIKELKVEDEIQVWLKDASNDRETADKILLVRR